MAAKERTDTDRLNALSALSAAGHQPVFTANDDDRWCVTRPAEVEEDDEDDPIVLTCVIHRDEWFDTLREAIDAYLMKAGV